MGIVIYGLEQLDGKIARWQEEVNVYGSETELTQAEIDDLNARRNELVESVRRLNVTYIQLMSR